MARTVKDAPITTSAARKKLPAQSKPHYRQIEPDLHLGFRKGKTGGRWCLRYYTGNGDYKVETFAKAIENDAAAIQRLDLDQINSQTPLTFKQAQEAAKRRYQARQIEAVHGHAGPITVRQVVEDYIAWLHEHRKSATTAERFAKVHIFPKLGAVDATTLTTKLLRDWHEGIAKAPRRKRVAEGAEPVYFDAPETDDEIRARKSTANRVRAVLVAALNQAFQDGRLPSDLAWKRAGPFKETERSRDRYFTRDECRRFINACDPDFRALVRGALYTGMRYGDLARMNVGDYDPDAATVVAHRPKSGKAYHVHLGDEAAAAFDQLTVGRKPRDLMFTKADGSRWRDSHQHRPFKAALERAKIESGTTPATRASFHTLRHTYASLAIMGERDKDGKVVKPGASLDVVAQNLGHADITMVQRHYGHLADDYKARMMRQAAPSFGLEETNVERIA